MEKTIYIHIGTGKTGTTALQEFLTLNEKLLMQLGVVYCRTGRINNCHHALCRNSYRVNNEAVEKARENLIKLNDEIKNTSKNKFIISSENFPGLNLSEIKEIFEIIDVHIVPIVYLRRQDEFLESWYAQIIKATDFSRNINIDNLYNELVSKKIFDYKKLISNWVNYSDDGRCLVRVYGKKYFYKESICLDFIHAIGIDGDNLGFNIPEKLSNTSIRPNQIKIGMELYPYCNNKQIKIILSPFSRLTDKSVHFLSVDKRENIIKTYKSANDYIAQKYLNRDSLFGDISFGAVSGGDSFDKGFFEYFLIVLIVHYPQEMKVVEPAVMVYLFDKIHVVREQGKLEEEKNLLKLCLIIRPNGPRVKKMLINFLERFAEMTEST